MWFLEPYIAWLIAGLTLVTLELLTGTFYLLVLGIAAFAGALTAYFSDPFWLQALVAAVVAVLGVFWVSKRRLSLDTPTMKHVDAGQPVSFESWVNRAAGHARVRYRDTSWEADIQDEPAEVMAGEVLYVVAVEGNTLKIARTRPA